MIEQYKKFPYGLIQNSENDLAIRKYLNSLPIEVHREIVSRQFELKQTDKIAYFNEKPIN